MATTVATTLALAPLVASDNDDAVKRLGVASTVLSEIMAAPDKGIPTELLEKAHCIVIVPELKTAAFGAGGKYGKGYLSCRNKSGAGWSAPGTVRIEGGSVGFQIGGSSTDLVMLVMNERGADKLLADKFTLGGEASAAAGPVGRTATAQTDAQMRADILSWSRTQGLFAGVALEGATLRQDLDDNARLYGKRLENRDHRDERRARAQGRHGADQPAEPLFGEGTDELVAPLARHAATSRPEARGRCPREPWRLDQGACRESHLEGKRTCAVQDSPAALISL